METTEEFEKAQNTIKAIRDQKVTMYRVAKETNILTSTLRQYRNGQSMQKAGYFTIVKLASAWDELVKMNENEVK